MDPASVAVASIGVAASLTTLAALVIEGSKTLFNVHRKVKNAPEDIRRLCRELNAFQCLLYKAQDLVRDDGPDYATSDMGTVFATAIDHMLDDLRGFKDSVQKLKGLMSHSTSSKDLFVLRVRHILKEDGVREYQRLICSHVATLTLLLEILTSSKLKNVSKQTTKLLANNHTWFKNIDSRLESFCTSQSEIRTFHQDKITNIEDRLIHLQQRLGADTTMMCGGRSGQEIVIARDAQFPRAYRKTYFDLGLFGQVASSRSITTGKRSNGPYHYHSTFTFIPPSWLSILVLHWDLQINSVLNRPPRLSFSLSPIRYNPSQELKAAITTFDVPGLQRLFREGLAQPTDYIVQRRPVSLLEAFASRVIEPTSRVLEMYKYLLREGCGNSDPLLATWHARILITMAKHSQSQLKEALDSFLEHGGSLFWQSSNRGTISSLIMRHGASFQYLRQYPFLQTEPWTVTELSQTDRWLVVALEHRDAKFRNALQDYLSRYRSGLRASQLLPSIHATVFEVQNASARDRIEFLKIVSKWGTGDMIAPFLGNALDLDENYRNEQSPWLRLSYLSKAVKGGNLDTFQTLLEAGACPTRALIYLSRHPASLPPCEKPELRKSMILALAERAQPKHLQGKDEEVLALLLRTHEVRKYCSRAADLLIDRFILQRFHEIKNQSETLRNRCILTAMFLGLPQILELFNNHGLLVCGHISIGKILGGRSVFIKGDVAGNYTWLTLAVDFGLVSCVKLFIDNGTDCTQLDPCGRTALDMAEDYVSRPHPRAATKLQIWPCQPPQRYVSTEDDQESLAALRLAARPQSAALVSGSRRRKHRRSKESEHIQVNKMWLHKSILIKFTQQNFEAFARAFSRHCQVQKLQAIATRLSRLTFIENLLLRAGYLLSLTALLLYTIVGFLPG